VKVVRTEPTLCQNHRPNTLSQSRPPPGPRTFAHLKPEPGTNDLKPPNALSQLNPEPEADETRPRAPACGKHGAYLYIPGGWVSWSRRRMGRRSWSRRRPGWAQVLGSGAALRGIGWFWFSVALPTVGRRLRPSGSQFWRLAFSGPAYGRQAPSANGSGDTRHKRPYRSCPCRD